MSINNFGDFILSLTRKAYRTANAIYNPSFATKKDFEFVNRQSGHRYLLIVLAGYQPYYFDAVFERVRKCELQFKDGIDVCICGSNCPQESKNLLNSLCQKNSWSFLFFRKNRITQIQNTAIMLHQQAEWIFKMDEDIILCDDYFTKMKDAYVRAEEELPYTVGFLGPVLNINAFGTQVFLKRINKWDEFQKLYGPFKVGGMINTPMDSIHNDREWAEYIWRCSIPFDRVASEIARSKEIVVCPIRFSIGAILIKREFFEYNGWLPVARKGGLGSDEKYLCDTCIEGMYGIAVATGIFVGHLGFGPQKEICHQFLIDHSSEIRLND